MIPRIVIPGDARISGDVPQEPSSAQKAHLVPRRLIPANAKLAELPEISAVAGQGNGHKPLVGKLLVPAGAGIGEAGARERAAGVRPERKLFKEALLNKGALQRKRGAAEWLISFGIHAAIIAAVVIVPLFFTHTLDLQDLQLTYLVAPPAPAPPPPPPAAVATHRAIPTHAPTVTAKLTMPIAIPKTIPKAVDNSADQAPPDLTAGVPGGVAGGVPGGQIGGILGGVLGGAGSVPPPPQPAAEPAAPSGPLHLGGSVKPPKALYTPPPRYPLLARQARVEGDVQIDAVIDKDGNVVQERAMAGPPLLIDSALETVKHWKYQPTYLNGVAWPIELTINVTFSLS